MLKKGAKATIFRTAMCGGGLAYDVLVEIGHVEHYDGTRYTTVRREGKDYLRFTDATMPEEHYAMPLGFERYDHYKEHEKAARKEAMKLACRVFPELRQLGEESLPELWRTGLLATETHAKKTTTCS